MRALTLLVIMLPGLAQAQLPTKTRGNDIRSRVITQAILPEFAPKSTGTIIAENYTETNPCVPHSHDYVFTLQVWRRSGVFPDPTAVLYRDGVQVEAWVLSTPSSANTTVNIGKFTWTADHPCPDGNASIGPNHPPNYRLVVDPTNRVAEQSEENNVLSFYMDPSRQFTKLP